MIPLKRSLCVTVVPVLAAFLIPGMLARANPSPDLSEVIHHVRSALDVKQAMTVMQTVYSTDRYFTFPAFQRTAKYLERAMRANGLADAQLVQAPADGRTQVGFWTMPLAWDVKSARLEILDDRLPREQRVLADYATTPASVGMWSGPTPTGGVEAEVVALGRADLQNVETLDLKGKLVLLDINPAGHKWILAKKGALGAINAFTENPELKDDRQWINAWGDSGWGYTKASTPLLSFSVTPNGAALLRKLLAKGPVRVRATVDSRYYEGGYPYVTGRLRGVDDAQEVLALAHTAEQGARKITQPV